MNFKKILVYPLGALLVAVVLYKTYGFTMKQMKRSKKEFSIQRVCPDKEYQLQEPLKVCQDDIEQANAILAQPFFFLDRGRQCYAFLSSDGHYVLKFFQQDRFRVAKDYVAFLPDSFLGKKLRKRKVKLRDNKREKALLSFELAKKYAAAETGVTFLHLKATKNQHQSVICLDKRGKLISIPLDNVQFALQRRAKLLKPTLISLMHENKVEEAKARLEQIFDLLVTCAKEGICDSDGALVRNDNLGFLEDKAIYIDIGKLFKVKTPITKAGFEYDLRRLRPLDKWLIKNYPVLASHFEVCQIKAIDQFHD